jgi:hypothetical protein
VFRISNGKSLIHPQPEGWNTSPPTYENGFFTPWTF